MLPIPILVVEYLPHTLNHPTAFINHKFVEQIGWALTDIPDKNHWWEKAYPEDAYQKVVARQWELEIALARDSEQGYVAMNVNIATKYQGIKRYNVITQIDCQLIDGHYVIAFELLR